MIERLEKIVYCCDSCGKKSESNNGWWTAKLKTPIFAPTFSGGGISGVENLVVDFCPACKDKTVKRTCGFCATEHEIAPEQEITFAVLDGEATTMDASDGTGIR